MGAVVSCGRLEVDVVSTNGEFNRSFLLFFFFFLAAGDEMVTTVFVNTLKKMNLDFI